MGVSAGREKSTRTSSKERLAKKRCDWMGARAQHPTDDARRRRRFDGEIPYLNALGAIRASKRFTWHARRDCQPLCVKLFARPTTISPQFSTYGVTCRSNGSGKQAGTAPRLLPFAPSGLVLRCGGSPWTSITSAGFFPAGSLTISFTLFS